MADTFVEQKLLWMEQVAMDVDLPASAYRVAVVLSTKYMNQEQGCAWPSVRCHRGAAGDLRG